jgi:nitrate/nitrite transporter NarK
MSLAAFCVYAISGIFWALPQRYLVGVTAAVGIAFINSFGNIGGFVGPYVVGGISDATGSPHNGMYFLAVALVAGAAGTLVLKRIWGTKKAATAAQPTCPATDAEPVAPSSPTGCDMPDTPVPEASTPLTASHTTRH